MKYRPMDWLCAALSLSGKHRDNPQGNFKITKISQNSAEVLHVPTGAVWQFTTKVIREPAT